MRVAPAGPPLPLHRVLDEECRFVHGVLCDLLLPAAERPVTFVPGTREYDPAKLGYQRDPPKVRA